MKETLGLWDDVLEYSLPVSDIKASVKAHGLDEMELLKVRSFLDMVDQVHAAGNCVSVPVSMTATKDLIREEIESWPLCQVILGQLYRRTISTH